MTTVSTLKLADCDCSLLDEASCQSWLVHLTQGATTAPDQTDLKWLLAHCDDGVVWGCLDAGQWRLANEEFPGVVPNLDAAKLQQLRVFGPRREVLLWRVDEGFNGRELAELPTPLPQDNPLHFDEAEVLLLGDHVLPGSPGDAKADRRFTLIGDRRGARHAVPWRLKANEFGGENNRHWPLRLVVRHYFACDDAGLIRVAASRLVDLKHE